VIRRFRFEAEDQAWLLNQNRGLFFDPWEKLGDKESQGFPAQFKRALMMAVKERKMDTHRWKIYRGNS